jgi:hypothetical protein
MVQVIVVVSDTDFMPKTQATDFRKPEISSGYCMHMCPEWKVYVINSIA